MSEQYFEEEEFSTAFNGSTLIRILGQVRPYWKWVLGFVLCVACVSALGSLFTFLEKRIIDEGIIAANRDSLKQSLMIYGALMLVSSGCVLGFVYLTGVLGYRVQYDRTADRIRLRTTVPIATDDVIVRVPRDFVTGVRPVAPAHRIEDQVFEDAQRTVLQLVRSEGRLDAGQSVLIELDGMAGVRQRNPLTEQPGASIAVGTALLALGALGLVLARRRGDA